MASELPQFKRLTRELAVLTVTPYITSDSVDILLEKERSSISSSHTSLADTSMDLERPLEEITRDIKKEPWQIATAIKVSRQTAADQPYHTMAIS